MARYRVGFDGHWQEDFDTEQDAVEWAEDVAETGRTVYVVKVAMLAYRLVAVLPLDQEPGGRKAWRRRWRGPPGPDPGAVPFIGW